MSDDRVVPTPSPDPTLFDWFSLIWIPLFVGVATVAVSVAALVASARATRIAHEVERQRERAAEERVEDAKRERLQGMAQGEARALHRFAVEALKPRRFRTIPLNSPPPPPSPYEAARVDARVMLEQSVVPAAGDLLELTEFDLSHRHDFLPAETEPDDSAGHQTREALRLSMIAARDRRMFERIRDWAIDPEVIADYIEFDLSRAKSDPENYLKIGHVSGG